MPLAEILDQFQSVDAATRLELLLEYSDSLPPLPPALEAQRDEGLGRIHECQTPVFLYPEVTGGVVHLHADVPRESPTVRGFVALLVEALDGANVAEVAALPEDLLYRLGLAQQLGMTRMQGLSAVLWRLKHAVAQT